MPGAFLRNKLSYLQVNPLVWVAPSRFRLGCFSLSCKWAGTIFLGCASSARDIVIQFFRRISSRGRACRFLSGVHPFFDILFLRSLCWKSFVGGIKFGIREGRAMVTLKAAARPDNRPGQTNASNCNSGLLISTRRSLSIKTRPTSVAVAKTNFCSATLKMRCAL